MSESNSYYAFQAFRLAPNPIIFWNLCIDGNKIVSMNNKYCGDVARDLRVSIASYLRQSHLQNCGSIDDLNDSAENLSALNVIKQASPPVKKKKKKVNSPTAPILPLDKRPRGASKPK